MYMSASVLRSDTYVLFCQFLSRWSGFQMTSDIVCFHLHIMIIVSYTVTMSYDSQVGRRMSELEMDDILCRMYMPYDIVGPYCKRHHMYVRCRMSTYDIVCQTYDVVCLLEVAVSCRSSEFRCFKGTRSPSHSTGK